jgi:hypothetical protein
LESFLTFCRDWTLGDKLWLLDDADNPKVLNADLGKAFACHLNENRLRVVFEPPSKQRVSEWRESTAAIRKQNTALVASSHKGVRTPKHPLLQEALARWFHQQEACSLLVTNDIL